MDVQGGPVKATNPKDAVGIRKIAFSVLPWRVLHRVGLAMLEGALKYGRHNYRAAGVRASVYFDSVVARHLSDWWEGVDIDPDSGEHHVDKAIAGLMVMRDSMLQGNFVDDRPPRGSIDFDDLNARAGALIDRYKDKEPPRHYTIADAPVPLGAPPPVALPPGHLCMYDPLGQGTCDGLQCQNTRRPG